MQPGLCLGFWDGIPGQFGPWGGVDIPHQPGDHGKLPSLAPFGYDEFFFKSRYAIRSDDDLTTACFVLCYCQDRKCASGDHIDLMLVWVTNQKATRRTNRH